MGITRNLEILTKGKNINITEKDNILKQLYNLEPKIEELDKLREEIKCIHMGVISDQDLMTQVQNVFRDMTPEEDLSTVKPTVKVIANDHVINLLNNLKEKIKDKDKKEKEIKKLLLPLNIIMKNLFSCSKKLVFDYIEELVGCDYDINNDHWDTIRSAYISKKIVQSQWSGNLNNGICKYIFTNLQ